MSQTTDCSAGSLLWKMLRDIDESAGTSEALKEIDRAQRVATARAARLLAERECPADLLEWGKLHNIPNFAEATWIAGFLAGMRVAALDAMSTERQP